MEYTYKGIRAIWHYSKNCWIVPFNGSVYECLDNEINATIDELIESNAN